MTAATGPIQHVVVLMMENHSFDHMLGWLAGIGELNGERSNKVGNIKYPVTEGAGYCTDPGPQHDLADVNMQLFGTRTPAPNSTPTMSGFAQDYTTIKGDPNLLMQCYSPDQVPVISTLAKTFTVCTRWFCSVPGPTGPNRIYANCASSKGYAGRNYLVEPASPDKDPPSASTDNYLPSDMSTLESIFGVLTSIGRNWGVYHQDPNFAPELILNEVLAEPGSIFLDPGFTTFQSHLKSGVLPDYSFLTPILWGNSQHAPYDIREGEILIADVYEAIANSDYWEKTLLILTYDEHGGFYDSVPTPTGVPNPDGIDWNANSQGWEGSPSFAFDRLGPRVPAILISPYVQAMVDARQYEHSSIPATVLELFGLSWPTPNQRLETVNTFQDRIGTTLRTDLPKQLPRPQMPATSKADSSRFSA